MVGLLELNRAIFESNLRCYSNRDWIESLFDFAHHYYVYVYECSRERMVQERNVPRKIRSRERMFAGTNGLARTKVPSWERISLGNECSWYPVHYAKTIRVGRIELFTDRVLCRTSYRVLDRVSVVQPSGGHPSEGFCAKSSLSTDARQLR